MKSKVAKNGILNQPKDLHDNRNVKEARTGEDKIKHEDCSYCICQCSAEKNKKVKNDQTHTSQ
jgi:hypothetical protein